MSRGRSICLEMCISAIVVSSYLAPSAAQGVLLTWDVDPAASSFQLTVPDQAVNVTGVGDVTVRFRDPASDSQWTDAGGRRAYIDGTITTLYDDSNSITFLAGSNHLFALEQVSLRPNPADWDESTYSYTNTRSAPAAFGARVRGTYVLLIFPITTDIAFLAMREVSLDISGGPLPLAGGTFASGETQCGISSALADVNGLEISGLGQPVPDLWRAPMSQVISTNNSGGSIQNLGGRNRKLTYNISMPLAIDLQGSILTGSGAGQIVAYATLPEPPPLRISQSLDQTVIVAWPAAVTGFVLEANTNLTTTGWVTVTNAPVIVDMEKQLTLPASGSRAFYRLRSE